MPELAAIADDCSGAIAVADVFASHSLPCEVILDPSAVPADAPIPIIDANLRLAAPELAEKTCRALAGLLRQAGATELFFKIDSQLRGPVTAMLNGARAGFGGRPGLLCPAWPEKSSPAPQTTLPQPTDWLPTQAHNQETIDHLYQSSTVGLPSLHAGSLGLALAIAKAKGTPIAPAPAPQPPGSTLFITCSHHPATQAQVAYLQSQGWGLILLDEDDRQPKLLRSAIANRLHSPQHAIIACRATLGLPPSGQPHATLQRLAHALPPLPPNRQLVISGGDTAHALLLSMNARTLHPRPQLLTTDAYLALPAPGPSHPIWIKPGHTGPPNLISHLAQSNLPQPDAR